MEKDAVDLTFLWSWAKTQELIQTEICWGMCM